MEEERKTDKKRLNEGKNTTKPFNKATEPTSAAHDILRCEHIIVRSKMCTNSGSGPAMMHHVFYLIVLISRMNVTSYVFPSNTFVLFFISFVSFSLYSFLRFLFVPFFCF